MLLPSFDVEKIRADFPLLKREINGKPLVYLDSAATSQKPQIVIDTISEFYRLHNANIHRGVHLLSEEATSAYENTRTIAQQFINAASETEIVFVRGATEGINLVAQSYGRSFLTAGDEILITGLEHHANIVPWQLLRDQIGIKLKVAPVNEAGEVILERFYAMLTPRTKIVAISHVSNAIGTINPIVEMVAAAKQAGAVVLVDGCQAAPHLPIDVQRINCDFYTFSGHKIMGPTGIGILYGRAELLNKMPPYQGGGDMIREVRFDKTTYADIPHKFEAGTPNIEGTVGLGAALTYVQKIGLPAIMDYEHELGLYLAQKVAETEDIRVIGQARHKITLLSFLIERTHPNDIGTLLDQLGIAVRTGHHCAMPLMQRFGIPGTVRASFSFYNTKAEIDALFAGIERVKRILVEPKLVTVPVTTLASTAQLAIAPLRQQHVGPMQPVNVEALKNNIITALCTIFDPEIPVNIYDLGLIYDIAVDTRGAVKVNMTLTAPGCPVAHTFPGEVQNKVASVAGVAEAEVELVWEPPWTQDKMSEAARLELGMF